VVARRLNTNDGGRVHVTSDDEAEVRALVGRLEAAWNGVDAAAFAAEFRPDADFVNVRGDYHSGRDAVEHGHAAILRGIYAGSTIRYSLSRVREVAPGVLVAHVDALLSVPAGPFAGDTAAIPSMVLVRDGGAWRIASFHNTARPRA
jgi:uncharacterized protein (TIGR02246 family)